MLRPDLIQECPRCGSQYAMSIENDRDYTWLFLCERCGYMEWFGPPPRNRYGLDMLDDEYAKRRYVELYRHMSMKPKGIVVLKHHSTGIRRVQLFMDGDEDNIGTLWFAMRADPSVDLDECRVAYWSDRAGDIEGYWRTLPREYVAGDAVCPACDRGFETNWGDITVDDVEKYRDRKRWDVPEPGAAEVPDTDIEEVPKPHTEEMPDTNIEEVPKPHTEEVPKPIFEDEPRPS